eukprot:CAMPEP_0198219216 /NCGR_PEP_ID=MMETSP1445-20131203/73078_1 /TAXON_ID=36898 /ORGANISM="Pyramimonas sp., Strain CCMP2087" /LENGTH=124 /DNA_ID=CAMNT_0043896545 /DNA_START=238 /DNA_END=611 /DNA_ORIENTATION=+
MTEPGRTLLLAIYFSINSILMAHMPAVVRDEYSILARSWRSLSIQFSSLSSRHDDTYGALVAVPLALRVVLLLRQQLHAEHVQRQHQRASEEHAGEQRRSDDAFARPQRRLRHTLSRAQEVLRR